MTAPTGYSPLRPPNERDVVQAIAGMPVFLGVLTSAAAARVNNATTAVPFNTLAANGSMKGSLAGKVLLLQPTAPGLVLPGEDATLTIVQQATPAVFVPPLSMPGVYLGANERVEITMGPTTPFLQFVAVTGNAALLVWEMV